MKSSNIAAQRTISIFHHLPTMASPAATAAPWRDTFLSHVTAMDEPSFTLSTLHPSSQTTLPRARTVIFRGMWASLPVNPKNPANLNPVGAYQSDLPTLTTDARMDKIPELVGSSSSSEVQGPQSCRGGPVEVVFWMPKVRTQWRLRGHTYIIGPDIDEDAAAPVRHSLRRWMRRGGDEAGSWSWSRELTAHFGNLSPLMRGSFRNPPPGTPVSKQPGEGEGPGQKVEDVHDKIARRNFRVIVVVPEEVDQVDLTNPERGRRWNYKIVETDGADSWKVTELWP